MKKQENNEIRINQLGFYPAAVKSFVLIDSEAESFYISNRSGQKIFSGELTDRGQWAASAEKVKTGDFSALTEPGDYLLFTGGGGQGVGFRITDDLYRKPSIDALKTYYFQRSIDIEEKYAPGYARRGGHPDNHCLYHPSTGKTEGVLDSPGGWYDAGDYGKYIVNAAVSVGTMLALYEMCPDVYPDGSLNIPESGNGQSDLLDEMRFELDWMLSMQDADGGVFHKITALVHDDFVMPAEADAQRYVIGKSTAASLDFAAVMAQASRIWSESDPDFSTKALAAARKARQWSLDNPEQYFSNPPGCNTGPYDDTILDEEFFWASAELYASTGEEEYRRFIEDKLVSIQFRIGESWRQYVDNIGYYSLLSAPAVSMQDKEAVKAGLMKLADSLLSNIERIPYEVPVEDFFWGSNSDFLNAAVILAVAHNLTGEKKYLDGIIKTADYIFGKNATGSSFVTGYGFRSPEHPHHRLFINAERPFPGFVVGGPNPNREDRQDLENAGASYPSQLPAKAYIDHTASYASNEICINWNAPAVFVLAYLDKIFK